MLMALPAGWLADTHRQNPYRPLLLHADADGLAGRLAG